jgi:hypothetical protein
VLELLPGRYNDRIRCRLHTISIDQNPAFTAQSYTWGKATQGFQVVVLKDGMEYSVSVTDNLFKALRGLRRHIRALKVWVDALCIKQQVDTEKSAQVAMMGDIYSAARCTFVWLGDSGKMTFTDSAQEFLDSLAWVHETLTTRRYLLWSDLRVWGRVVLMLSKRYPPQMRRALLDAQPSWCSRAWVVQELIKSRRVFF